MKKVLLTGLAVFASLASTYAQCTGCLLATKPNPALPEGYHFFSNYAKDNFAVAPRQLQDVYWWTQLTGPKTVKVDSADNAGDCVVGATDVFSYSWSRTSGKLSYVLTQPYGLYEPVGVGFGKYPVAPGSTDSLKRVLDLSKDHAFLSFAFKNTSTYDYVLKVGLQDAKDSIVNAVGTTADGTVYLDEIGFTVAAGKSIDTTISFNTNAYKAVYTYLPCHVGSAFGKDKSFDSSKVAGVTFTVVNAVVVPTDGYKPKRLTGATFEITKFFVGNLTASESAVGLFNNAIAKPTFKVSPNPVNSGSVKFEKAENVSVSDLMGKVVYSAPSASEINVESFNKGIYIITTSKGAARFVVE